MNPPNDPRFRAASDPAYSSYYETPEERERRESRESLVGLIIGGLALFAALGVLAAVFKK